MIPLIFALIGIVVCFMKKISVTGTTEVRRPRTIVLGLLLLLPALMSIVFPVGLQTGAGPLIKMIIPILIPLISVFFLKQPKEQTPPSTTVPPSM